MSCERFRYCKDARARMKGNGARERRHRLIEIGKPRARQRAVASSHDFKRWIELPHQIQLASYDTKRDYLRADGQCRQQL